mmetsp:Transcript_6848/g.16553  ORF Transcript_6848/g.16553 Transcript_6848/m.16553 type:complete len:105 (-) Transcript_6848:155-469(-)
MPPLSTTLKPQKRESILCRTARSVASQEKARATLSIHPRERLREESPRISELSKQPEYCQRRQSPSVSKPLLLLVMGLGFGGVSKEEEERREAVAFCPAKDCGG